MATKKMAMGGKPSGNLPGLDKLRKFEANPANKAEVAKRAAFADKMKSDMAARQSANSDKVQAMKAQANAAKARQAASAAKPVAKPVAKPAMPPRPMGGMGARAGMTRPAMGGMGMKKGGATKAKKK